MIIILEGPDGVGKSTLADAIDQVWGGPVVRINCGPPPEDEFAYLHYMDLLDDAEKVIRSHHADLVVFDRFHVGELVYGPMFRGESGLSMEEAQTIEQRLDDLNAVKVHCLLDYDIMIARQIKRDGGKPDEKSGAGMKHARAIRMSFIWLLGDRKRLGALRRWHIGLMDLYPQHLASALVSTATAANEPPALEAGP